MQHPLAGMMKIYHARQEVDDMEEYGILTKIYESFPGLNLGEKQV